MNQSDTNLWTYSKSWLVTLCEYCSEPPPHTILHKTILDSLIVWKWTTETVFVHFVRKGEEKCNFSLYQHHECGEVSEFQMARSSCHFASILCTHSKDRRGIMKHHLAISWHPVFPPRVKPTDMHHLPRTSLSDLDSQHLHPFLWVSWVLSLCFSSYYFPKFPARRGLRRGESDNHPSPPPPQPPQKSSLVFSPHSLHPPLLKLRGHGTGTDWAIERQRGACWDEEWLAKGGRPDLDLALTTLWPHSSEAAADK